MTFDPNATPECASFVPTEEMDAAEFAMYLEKKGRIAEEKLRIALNVLENSHVYDYPVVRKALEEIERVGK